MNVLLVSFFCSNNLGDLLIARNLLDSFKTCDVTAFDFPTAKKISDVSDLHNLSEIPKAAKVSFLKSFCAEWYSWFLMMLKKEMTDNYITALKGNDCVVIGGGNMLMDLSFAPSYTYRFYKYTKTAKRLGKKVYVVSLGVGPFKNVLQRIYARAALRNVDYIGVRDSYSKKQCEALNLKKNVLLTSDAAFAAECNIEKIGNTNAIGICIADYLCISGFCSYEEYISVFSAFIERLGSQFKNYKLYVFSTEKADYMVINDILGTTRFSENIKIKNINSMSELTEFYKQIDCLIGMRMHSLIIAMLCHVPCFGIGWQKKVESLFEISNGSERYIDFESFFKGANGFAENVFSNVNRFGEIIEKQNAFISNSEKKYNEQIDFILNDMRGN